MLRYFLFVFLVISVTYAQEESSPCPISKKEAYILYKKHDPQSCELTEKEAKYILSLRKENRVDEVHQYVQRLRFEEGDFSEE